MPKLDCGYRAPPAGGFKQDVDDGLTDAPHRCAGWDTAGTESFRSITRSYYRGAAGCLLVYDVTSRQSACRSPHRGPTSLLTWVPAPHSPLPPPSLAGFMNVRSWLADVREHADPHLTCILVGNKIDLCSDDGGGGPGTRPRAVSTEEGALFAQEEGLLFVEASAKSGENVEAAFERATRDILDKVHRGVFDDDRVSNARFLLPPPRPCAQVYQAKCHVMQQHIVALTLAPTPPPSPERRCSPAIRAASHERRLGPQPSRASDAFADVPPSRERASLGELGFMRGSI